MAVFLNKAKSLAINGGFDNWQRGTSFSAIANATYFADRFGYGKSGAMVHTVSRSTDVPTFAQSGATFQYSARLNLTTADAALAASDQCGIYQKIEGYNFANLRDKYICVSFWVKATLAGVYPMSFRNANLDRSYVTTFQINTSNTWEKKIIVLRHEDFGTWDYDNGIGLWVQWGIAHGTTYHAPTLNTWLDGDYRGHASCVNGVNTGATDFYITGVQIEQGESASNFERFGGSFYYDQLACLRYFLNVQLQRRRVISQVMFDGYDLPVPMRTFPVLVSGSISDNGTLTISNTNPTVGLILAIYMQGSIAATANGTHTIAMQLDSEL